jgi:hypothetical protein
VSTDGTSIIALLGEQHERIEGLLDQIPGVMGSEREQAFLELRRLLAVHEVLEQRMVHPLAMKQHVGAPGRRVAEEVSAAELLTTLEGLDIESTRFETNFRDLQRAVLAHAESEELTEFAELEGRFDQADLARAREVVARVEAVVTVMQTPFAAMREAALQALDRTADRQPGSP